MDISFYNLKLNNHSKSKSLKIKNKNENNLFKYFNTNYNINKIEIKFLSNNKRNTKKIKLKNNYQIYLNEVLKNNIFKFEKRIKRSNNNKSKELNFKYRKDNNYIPIRNKLINSENKKNKNYFNFKYFLKSDNKKTERKIINFPNIIINDKIKFKENEKIQEILKQKKINKINIKEDIIINKNTKINNNNNIIDISMEKEKKINNNYIEKKSIKLSKIDKNVNYSNSKNEENNIDNNKNNNIKKSNDKNDILEIKIKNDNYNESTKNVPNTISEISNNSKLKNISKNNNFINPNNNIETKKIIKKIEYKGMQFSQKILTNSPICEKCLRLVLISFDYIKNYILTYCFYCKNVRLYEYDTFIEELNENKNYLLNSHCKFCNKIFIFSDNNNPFYLIENYKDEFLVICEECFKINNIKDYRKKIKFEELIHHNLYLYDNEKNNNELNTYKINEQQNEKINKIIQKNLKALDEYNNNLLFIESIIKDVPKSLRIKAEKKLSYLKKEIIIKKKIIEYYNKFSNFIIVNNMILLLKTIFDFSDLYLLKYEKKTKYIISNELIKYFINCEKFLIIEELNPKLKFDFNLITINYQNKEHYNREIITNDNLILKSSYLNVLNIDFEEKEIILYNIIENSCFSKKIVPLSYNLNISKKELDNKEILIYNYKNDKRLYYGKYNISHQILIESSLSLLINENIQKVNTIKLMNNNEDLFILADINRGNILTFIYYIINFRTEVKIKKYFIDFNNYKIINNQTNICLKLNNKLVIISKNKLKEIKLPNDKIYIQKDINKYINNDSEDNLDNYDKTQYYMKINDIKEINGLYNNLEINLEDNDFELNQINENNNYIVEYKSLNRNSDYLKENQDKESSLNYIVNPLNIAYDNFNPMNIAYDNLNYFYKEFRPNEESKKDSNNSIMNTYDIEREFFSLEEFKREKKIYSIFKLEEFGRKNFYKDILKLNNNFFIIVSSKHIKGSSFDIINYFYLSLYDFNTLEEITKIEICKINSSDYLDLNISIEKNIISIRITNSTMSYPCMYEFKNNQLQFIE